MLTTSCRFFPFEGKETRVKHHLYFYREYNESTFSPPPFLTFRYLRNPISLGVRNRRALPRAPSPLAVRPTRWMYSWRRREREGGGDVMESTSHALSGSWFYKQESFYYETDSRLLREGLIFFEKKGSFRRKAVTRWVAAAEFENDCLAQKPEKNGKKKPSS